MPLLHLNLITVTFCYMDYLSSSLIDYIMFKIVSKKYDHFTSIMKQLHWLLINQRIIYKVALITYKALNGLAPHYIRNMLKHSISSVNQRSSCKGLLIVPRVRRVNYGERSFSYGAPKLWNEIPEYILNSEMLTYKRNN